MKQHAPVKKNDELTVTITDLTYQGLGVAKVDGYPLFVTGALPAERVVIHVTKVQKNFGYARVVRWETTSPDRTAAPNKVLTQTGIAPLAHLSYAAQLRFKRKLITDLLQKAHLEIEVAPVMGMDDPWHYRNKAQVPVREVDGHLRTGFYRQRSHQFVPVTDYGIQDERIDAILQVVCTVCDLYKVPAYDEEHHRGVLRHIMVRRGYYSHEVMVVLVTRTQKLPHAQEIAAQIMQRCSDVVGVMHNVNPKRTNVIMGETTTVLAGQPTITDELNGVRFAVSAQSFYQVNPQQTERLYATAVERAHLTPEMTAVDAYCGIGTITLTVARHVKHVYGVEVVPEAIKDARRNAALNGVTNATFAVGTAQEWMAKWADQGIRPDVVFVDPPRKGLTPDLIASIAQMAPQRVVYVSCNPATLVRDLQQFMQAGYRVSAPIQPVDQFPQTVHVESVTVLERTDK